MNDHRDEAHWSYIESLRTVAEAYRTLAEAEDRAAKSSEEMWDQRRGTEAEDSYYSSAHQFTSEADKDSRTAKAYELLAGTHEFLARKQEKLVKRKKGRATKATEGSPIGS